MVAKQSAGTKPKPAAAVDAAGTAKAPLKPKESIKVFARFRPLEPGAELRERPRLAMKAAPRVLRDHALEMLAPAVALDAVDAPATPAARFIATQQLDVVARTAPRARLVVRARVLTVAVVELLGAKRARRDGDPRVLEDADNVVDLNRAHRAHQIDGGGRVELRHGRQSRRRHFGSKTLFGLRMQPPRLRGPSRA